MARQGQLSCFPSLPSCLLQSLEEPWVVGALLARGRSFLGAEVRLEAHVRCWCEDTSGSVSAELMQGVGLTVASPAGGAPQPSLHLTALVQLVKEIPEFLFGEVSPVSPDGERVSPEETADTRRPTGKEGPGAAGRKPSSPAYSPDKRKNHGQQERGTLGAGPVGISPGNSPLQGLINCLKEILVPGPQYPEMSLNLPLPVPGQNASPLTRAELQPGSLPWGVKTEAASRDCPLQGLLNCLKEIPEVPDSRPSLSGVEDLWLQEDQGAWKRNSAGPRPLRTSLPGPSPGAGSAVSVVKTENDWAQSPPVSASCQLSKWTHSPAATSSPGCNGDPTRVLVSRWGPAAQGEAWGCLLGAAHPGFSMHTQALPAPRGRVWLLLPSSPPPLIQTVAQGTFHCKDLWSREHIKVPLLRVACLADHMPAIGFIAPAEGGLGPPAWGWAEWLGQRCFPMMPAVPFPAEVTVGPLLALGLQGCVRDSSALPPGPQSTPTSFSSSSSTDGDLDFQSPEGSQGHQPGKGSPVGSPPLPDLENCLREIPAPRPRPACSWSLAGDRGPRSAEPKNWTADKEGLRGEACEPVQLGQQVGYVPPRSLQLASLQVPTSSSVPSCYQRGFKDQVTRPGPWRCLQDGAATEPSPLHRLESSLKGILPGRPLRFACLVGPSPRPGSSSSSSSSSSEGEDLRLEPELWQPLQGELSGGEEGARVLGLHPNALAAPLLAAALVKARGEQSPGAAVLSVQATSLYSPRVTSVCSQQGKQKRWEAGPSHPGEKHAWTPWASVAPLAVPEEGQLSAPALLCGWRKGLGWGPASLLGQPWDSCPGSPGSVKNPGAWSLEMEEQVLQVNWWLYCPLKLSGALQAQGYAGSQLHARNDGRPLPRGPREPPPAATVPPAFPPASARPLCPCGGSLQQELQGLSAALSEKLDQLATALAGLSQEVASMRTQVDRLGRCPRSPRSKGLASWHWSRSRGPRWANGPAPRPLPYWRQKGPTRPKPKILRGQAEGCSAGDSSGLSLGRLHLVLPLPPDAPPAEPSGPHSSPYQQPLSACTCRALLTVHAPLGHSGGPQSPPVPAVPAALPPQMALPAASADTEPLAAAAVPTGTPDQPKDPNSLVAGVERTLEEELWGGEHRDLRWGVPCRLLHQLSPAEEALPPATSPRACPSLSPCCSQTFPISRP
ncbi:hypothetical protein MC885_019193 [Smutsia gigantea]|nr:hypothetical protein MC885_019193 [Smutsia gigantea]